jgi:predicted phage terminase large subunit-like protein
MGMNAMASETRILQALLRDDFRAFTRKVFATLAPAQTYVPTWHIEAVAWRLERVRRGEIRRLIINLPPRSLKSIMTSVAFPAFVLGLRPSRRIICVSYSGDLAKKHSNDFRAVLESPWYRSAFPNARIGPYKNSETEIELSARGFRLATSVGGTLTGRGGDIIIIDDPLKPDDALSEPKRSGANQWFTNTLLSRLDDKRSSAIVVVMQRVHMDDLTGFLLEQSADWDVLNLPAIAENEEIVQLWGGRDHRRQPGEALSPDREPLDVLQALKRQIGSDAFSAQYQQMPVPPGGAMIKRDWIIRYDDLPPASERLLTLQSWDTASKGGPDNDWSVCTTWMLTRKKKWYLLDVWRGRVDYPTLKATAQTLAHDWKARRVLVEDAGTGTALVQELRTQVSGIIAVKPEGDKASRMAVASAKFEAGQVLLPNRAPWLADLEAELFAFPGSRHDDQCDSISQALLNDNSGAWMALANWEAILKLAGRGVRLVTFDDAARHGVEILGRMTPFRAGHQDPIGQSRHLVQAVRRHLDLGNQKGRPGALRLGPAKTGGWGRTQSEHGAAPQELRRCSSGWICDDSAKVLEGSAGIRNRVREARQEAGIRCCSPAPTREPRSGGAAARTWQARQGPPYDAARPISVVGETYFPFYLPYGTFEP